MLPSSTAYYIMGTYDFNLTIFSSNSAISVSKPADFSSQDSYLESKSA